MGQVGFSNGVDQYPQQDTPGCMAFVLSWGSERDIIFSGDACKNLAELISSDADMTYDPAVTRASIATIWELWEAKPGSIVVPGHDLPMILEDEKPRYLGDREAAIQAWYGEGRDETTIISLT
ncbi:MAG: hypothetical protein JKX91_10330 [Rhizobiaceae bacterium]|nr:hypothetical protein [Rhizobiaceae bacterium]